MTFIRRIFNIGVKIDYRFDGGFYKLTRFKAKKKAIETQSKKVIETFMYDNPQYTDDCAALCETKESPYISYGNIRKIWIGNPLR